MSTAMDATTTAVLPDPDAAASVAVLIVLLLSRP